MRRVATRNLRDMRNALFCPTYFRHVRLWTEWTLIIHNVREFRKYSRRVVPQSKRRKKRKIMDETGYVSRTSVATRRTRVFAVSKGEENCGSHFLSQSALLYRVYECVCSRHCCTENHCAATMAFLSHLIICNIQRLDFLFLWKPTR